MKQAIVRILSAAGGAHGCSVAQVSPLAAVCGVPAPVNLAVTGSAP